MSLAPAGGISHWEIEKGRKRQLDAASYASPKRPYKKADWTSARSMAWWRRLIANKWTPARLTKIPGHGKWTVSVHQPRSLQGAEAVSVPRPGAVRTESFEESSRRETAKIGVDADTFVQERFVDKAALRRMVTPDEIAEAVAFFTSPRASGITGTHLKIDCGRVA